MAIEAYKSIKETADKGDKEDIMAKYLEGYFATININATTTLTAETAAAIDVNYVGSEGCSLCNKGWGYNHTSSSLHMQRRLQMHELNLLSSPSKKLLFHGCPSEGTPLTQRRFLEYWGSGVVNMAANFMRTKGEKGSYTFRTNGKKSYVVPASAIKGATLAVVSYKGGQGKYKPDSASKVIPFSCIPEDITIDAKGAPQDLGKDMAAQSISDGQEWWPVLMTQFDTSDPSVADLIWWETHNDDHTVSITTIETLVPWRTPRVFVICIYQLTMVFVEGWLCYVGPWV